MTEAPIIPFDMGVLSPSKEKEKETAKTTAQIYKKSNIFL